MELPVTGNPARATLVGGGDVSDRVGPYADFFWSNWCGSASAPFTASALAGGTQQMVTTQLRVAPPCDDHSKPSTLTLQLMGPAPTVPAQPR